MPAPGEQHLGRQVTNPFEEKIPRISEYTAQDIATLSSRLGKQLGPEFISSRAGPGGGKVHYLAAEKCIQLANEVFGFNGWSSQIMDIQVDFVDENPTTFKVTLGLSVVMRVTLRDGTFHEDIGYGHIENCKGKAAAFEKAKKEGTTDGLKRALKNFGNVLGNCIYDKDYLAKVTKMKAGPTKWDPANLHRHPDYVVKKEPESVRLEEKSQVVSQNASIAAPLATEESLDDEFGDFDEADFGVADPDAHPDEVVLPPVSVASRNISGGVRSGSGNLNGNGNTSITPNAINGNHNRPIPVARPQQPQPQAHARSGSQGAQNHNIAAAQPQTPNAGFSRASNGQNAMKPPDMETPRQIKHAPHIVGGKALNQPSRTAALNQPSRVGALNQPSRTNAQLSAPASPARLTESNDDGDGSTDLPPEGQGFFSARAAALLPEGAKIEAKHLNPSATFNPHAEFLPSTKKTEGIDHTKSKPLGRNMKHVAPSPSQQAAVGGSASRANVMNPQLDTARRIGVPGSGSPLANRGGYKPVTVKRPAEGGVLYPDLAGARVPLHDLPANETVVPGDGGDVKRQRLNG